MVEFRETVTIDRSVADVVRVLHDVERWPSWTASMSRIKRHGSGPLAVGETATVKQPRLPEGRWTVTVADDTGFAWTSATPGVRSRGEHWAEETGDGRTKVTLILAMSGPLAGITGLLYARLIRRYLRMESEGLRREVEAKAAGG